MDANKLLTVERLVYQRHSKRQRFDVARFSIRHNSQQRRPFATRIRSLNFRDGGEQQKRIGFCVFDKHEQKLERRFDDKSILKIGLLLIRQYLISIEIEVARIYMKEGKNGLTSLRQTVRNARSF